MLKFAFRVWRYSLVAALGAAAAAKFILESRAEPESQEIDLVSIFEATNLTSVADPFSGGKVLNLFAATNLDLRKAQPGPTGIELDLAVLCGAVNILLPEGWRVRSELTVGAAGFTDATRTDANPDAPVLRLTGFAVLSGVSVQARPSIAIVS